MTSTTTTENPERHFIEEHKRKLLALPWKFRRGGDFSIDAYVEKDSTLTPEQIALLDRLAEMNLVRTSAVAHERHAYQHVPATIETIDNSYTFDRFNIRHAADAPRGNTSALRSIIDTKRRKFLDEISGELIALPWVIPEGFTAERPTLHSEKDGRDLLTSEQQAVLDTAYDAHIVTSAGGQGWAIYSCDDAGLSRNICKKVRRLDSELVLLNR